MNLSEDPALQGCLVYHLTGATCIGSDRSNNIVRRAMDLRTGIKREA